MMHLLCKYDVAHFIRNDAMFSNSLGEADNIHEVNIISEAPSFAIRQTSLKKLLEKSQGVFLSFVSEKEPGKKPRIFLSKFTKSISKLKNNLF